MKKFSWLFIFLLTGVLAACGNKDKSNEYFVYYLNMDSTSVIREEYKPVCKSGNVEELTKELLEKLQGEPDKTTLRQTIPSDMKYSFYPAGYILNLDFDEKFYDLTGVEQTLVRAAVVKTLIQIQDYSFVNITVNSEPLVDMSGNVVGSMNEDSFVENPGEQINSKQKTQITLFFADANDSTKLVQKTENVTYTNKTLEKVVMEKLIEGPADGDGMLATLPSTTKIINSSIYDGVCYINLTDTFVNNQNNEIPEQVVLYSIVNSLCSLQEVNKVQITVNGESSGKVRYNFDLSTMYEYEDSILAHE